MRVANDGILKMHWTSGQKPSSFIISGAERPLIHWLRGIPMRPEVLEKKIAQGAGLHSIALERHYSVPEIAELWSMSEKSVRRLFAGENGVLEWGTHESARKRGYLNLRIPESVLIRVHQRRQRAS